MTLRGQKEADLVVKLDGNVLPIVLKVPDLARRRVDILKRVPLWWRIPPSSARRFSRILIFDTRRWSRRPLVLTTLHTRFFDANWNEVTVPENSGSLRRAVVEFHGKDNVFFTRYLTLYKTPQPLHSHQGSLQCYCKISGGIWFARRHHSEGAVECRGIGERGPFKIVRAMTREWRRWLRGCKT